MEARKAEGLSERNAIENMQAVRLDVTVPLQRVQPYRYDHGQLVRMLDQTLAANP